MPPYIQPCCRERAFQSRYQAARGLDPALQWLSRALRPARLRHPDHGFRVQRFRVHPRAPDLPDTPKSEAPAQNWHRIRPRRLLGFVRLQLQAFPPPQSLKPLTGSSTNAVDSLVLFSRAKIRPHNIPHVRHTGNRVEEIFTLPGGAWQPVGLKAVDIVETRGF